MATPSIGQIVLAYQNANEEQRIKALNILIGIPEAPQEESLLNLKQTCKILNCSPATIDRYVKAGKLPVCQSHGRHSRRFFKLVDIRTFIENSRMIVENEHE